MKTSIINEIISFIFGRKYYAITAYARGTTNVYILGDIYTSKEEANKKKQELENENLSYKYIETISFRSRRNYF